MSRPEAKSKTQKRTNHPFLFFVGVAVAAFSALFFNGSASEPDESQLSPGSQEAGHELMDAHFKTLMKFGIGIIVSAVILFVSIGAFFGTLHRHYPENVIHHEPPPTPRLQSNPSADLQTYLDRENNLLSSYGWVDRKAGVVHIPIDRAMDILAAKSRPAQGGTP